MTNSIFKKKEPIKPKTINSTECENIDDSLELIPLYFEPVFKKIFQNHTLLKKFIITELNLKKSYEKQKLYYGKSILLNRYGPFVSKTSILIKLNNSSPMVITFAKIDYKKGYKDNLIYELNINRDKVKKDNRIRIINRTKKDLKYYRKLYENNINLEKRNLLLVALTSKTFKELHEILIKVFNEEEVYSLLKSLIKISRNKKIINQWKIYRYKI